MKCPKCRRKQYWQCGNPKCPDRNIPKNAKPQVNLDNDAAQCPYCGFTAHLDYWEGKAMKELRVAEGRTKHLVSGRLYMRLIKHTKSLIKLELTNGKVR